MAIRLRVVRTRPPTATTTARRRLIAITVCFAVLPAACSEEAPQAEGIVATTQPAPETTAETRPATTTTTTTTTTTMETVVDNTTTTVAVVVPTWPLTGLPLPDGVNGERPAMVVKLDNHPDSRPQTGLNEADIVYEENVEQLTRFAAVFQSNGADPVGPIRSGRTQDIDLLGSLNRPLYIWSGGNRRVTDAIRASDLREFSEQTGGPFFRTSRPRPHDLYANMSELYALAPADASAPSPQFEYRPADDEPAGEEIVAAKISMDGVRVLWQWDPDTDKFLRLSDDKVHKETVFDAQVSTENVLVMFVEYRPSPADGRSPEAQTVGTGEVWVYSAGKLVKGTWTRPDRLSPFLLTDASGDTILLTPGRVFVELARFGKGATVPDGTDIASVPYP